MFLLLTLDLCTLVNRGPLILPRALALAFLLSSLGLYILVSLLELLILPRVLLLVFLFSPLQLCTLVILVESLTLLHTLTLAFLLLTLD